MESPASAPVAPPENQPPDAVAAPAQRADKRWLLLLLLAPALLWHCWRAPFLGFDDGMYLRDNPLLKPGASWLELLRIHASEHFYYPLTMLGWRIDREFIAPLLTVFGLNADDAWATAIRGTNLLLHTGSAALVWLTLRRLGAHAVLAAFVMLAFALHPSACESVCWTIELKNVLAGFLAFAALYVYIRAESARGFALAALLFLAANLAKPSALGMLPVVACWELLGRPRLCTAGVSPATVDNLQAGRLRYAAALRVLPWVVIAGGIVALTLFTQQKNLMAPPGGSIFTALLTDVVVLVRYFALFLLPDQSSAYYAVQPITRVSDPQLWLHGAVLLVFVGATILLTPARLRRTAAWSWLWFVGALGPTLNLVGINDLMHDRFVYLSAPAFWLALGLALQGAAARLPSLQKPLRAARAPALLALALLLAFAAADRSRYFSSGRLLFEDAVRKEPASAYAQIFYAQTFKNEALELQERGDPRREKAQIEQLLTYTKFHLQAGMAAPDYARYQHKHEVLIDLAQVNFLQGNFADAERCAAAVAADADAARLYVSKARQVLGQVAFEKKDYRAAVAHFDAAVAADPARTVVYLSAAKAIVALAEIQDGQGHRDVAAQLRALAREFLGRVTPETTGYAKAQALLKQLE